MDADRWRHVSRLFHQALDVPAPERPAFLDRGCGGDQALRDEVESLLRNDGSGEGLLGSLPATTAEPVAIGAVAAQALGCPPPQLVVEQ